MSQICQVHPSCPLASTVQAESPDITAGTLEIFQLLGSCSFSFWLVVEPTPLKNMRTSKWIVSPGFWVKIRKIFELPLATT